MKERKRDRNRKEFRQDSNLKTQSCLNYFKNSNPTSGLPTPSNAVSHSLSLTRLLLRVRYCSGALFIFLCTKRKWFMLGLKPWKILPQKHDQFASFQQPRSNWFKTFIFKVNHLHQSLKKIFFSLRTVFVSLSLLEAHQNHLGCLRRWP